MDNQRAALLKKHAQDAGEFCEITAEDLIGLVDATKYADEGCRACADSLRPQKAGQRIPRVNVNILTKHVQAMLAKVGTGTSNVERPTSNVEPKDSKK